MSLVKSILLTLMLSPSVFAMTCQQAVENLSATHFFYLSEINSLIPVKTMNALKSLPRAGWIRRGIPVKKAETVWWHSAKVERSVTEFIGSRYPQLLLRGRLMARVHDIGEAIIGDYTPHDKISPKQKFQAEYKAIQKIGKKLNPYARNLLESLWLEYEAGKTPLSKFVKDLDKIDAAVQAMVYSKKGYNVEEFFPYTRKVVKTPELQEVFETLHERFLQGELKDPYGVYYELLSAQSPLKPF